MSLVLAIVLLLEDRGREINANVLLEKIGMLLLTVA